LLVVALLTVAAGGSSLWLLIASGLLALVAAVDAIAGRPPLLQVERQLPSRWVLGEENRASLLIRAGDVNDDAGRRSISVLVSEAWPQELELHRDAQVVKFSGAEFVHICEVRPLRHGVLEWTQIRLSQSSALGLWDFVQSFELPARVEVLPRFELSDVALQQLRDLGSVGERRGKQRGEGSEFDSLREYRPGDEPSRIDWKATARSGKVVSRQFTVDRQHDVYLALDTGRLMAARFDGVAKGDRALSAMLTLAQQALLSGDRVGWMSFDAKLRQHIGPGKEMSQMAAILEAATRAQPELAETDFARSFMQVAQLQRKRSLFVVCTDFVDEASSADMVEVLTALKQRHAILFVAVSDPSLADIIRKPAASASDLAAQATAFHLVGERKKVLDQLRRLGLQVLDLSPDQITGSILNHYFEMRERELA